MSNLTIEQFDIAVVDKKNHNIILIHNKKVIKKDKEQFEKSYLELADIMQVRANYDSIQNDRYSIVYDKRYVNNYKITHVLDVTYIGDNGVKFIDNNESLYKLLCKHPDFNCNNNKTFQLNLLKNKNILIGISIFFIFIILIMLKLVLTNINEVNQKFNNIELLNDNMVKVYNKIDSYNNDLLNIKEDLDKIKNSNNNLNSYNIELNKRLNEIENKINYIILQNIKSAETSKYKLNKKDENNIFDKYNKILDDLEKGL